MKHKKNLQNKISLLCSALVNIDQPKNVILREAAKKIMVRPENNFFCGFPKYLRILFSNLNLTKKNFAFSIHFTPFPSDKKKKKK